MRIRYIETTNIIDCFMEKDSLVVCEKKDDGFIKKWYCEPISPSEFIEFINIKNTQQIIELQLKEGK